MKQTIVNKILAAFLAGALAAQSCLAGSVTVNAAELPKNAVEELTEAAVEEQDTGKVEAEEVETAEVKAEQAEAKEAKAVKEKAEETETEETSKEEKEQKEQQPEGSKKPEQKSVKEIAEVKSAEEQESKPIAYADSDFEIEGTVLTKYVGSGGNVVIPNGITEIGNWAFQDCTALQTVSFPTSVTKIGYGSFIGCRGLRKITLNNGLVTIGANAFAGCSALRSLVIPNTVTEIYYSAFKECSALSSVSFSNKLQKIEYDAFRGTALTSVTLPASVIEIGGSVFEECSNLINVTINGKVETISSCVFRNCTNLQSVTLSSGIKTIGYDTFRGCKSLKSITLPSALEEIGSNAFYDCDSISSIVIPNTVTEIYYGAFQSCDNLTKITLGSGLKKIGYDAFCETPITSVSVPANVEEMGGGIFRDCTELKSANIQASGELPSAAFRGCTSLTTVTLGNKITVVSYEAFSNCPALTSINIPSSVTEIGARAFYDCSLLQNISIPESVTVIRYEAFKNCTNLKKIEIPESVTIFGYDIFYNIPNLTIYGVNGSFAEDYANEYKIPFVGTVIASFYSDKQGSVLSGTPVKLWVTVTGGTGAYQYKFLIRDQNDNWAILRNYSSQSSITWTPGATGKKRLYVDIKEGNGNVVRKELVFTVTAPLAGTFSASQSGTVAKGTNIALTAAGTGGAGNYQYKFLIRDQNDNWCKLRDYTSNNKLTWVPGATGKKTLYVDIKDASGKVVRKGLVFTVTAQTLLSGSFTANRTGNVPSGVQVAFTASASGGSGNYRYKFLIKDQNENWFKLRDYTSNNKITWTPTATGRKNLYVDIKDGKGTVIRKSLVFTVTAPLTGNFSASQSGTVIKGTNIAFTASASGGAGNYQYKFLIKDQSENWFKLRDYTSNNKITWTPTATGRKNLYVDIKDSPGKVIRKALTFVVTEKNTLTITSFTTNTYPGKVGKPIEIKATAQGGSGFYQYKFLLQDPKTGAWFKIKDFSPYSYVTWTPGGTGEKKLYVDVKDSTGIVVRKSLAFYVTN